MIIKSLDLKAFGPFTDVKIDFTSQSPGLHIIHGANEAGKSSSLRALHALLFGFPLRTSDNFLHPNPRLLVAGCLQNRNGRQIYFQRRKRKKADLLDEKGEMLEQGLLAQFLHGMSPALFSSLYGISYEALVQGGADILDQKGEVGKAIFSAGTGLGRLRGAIESMESEAERLFKPQGSTPEINKEIREYEELKRDIKNSSLNSREWEEHKLLLDSSREELRAIEKLKDDGERQRRHLERLQRMKPQFALREKVLRELLEKEEAVVLPDDFSRQRGEVEKEMSNALAKRENATQRLEQFKSMLSGLAVNQSVLDQAEIIENLHQRLGEYKKASRDQPKLEGMRINTRREVSRILSQGLPGYALDDVDLLRPVMAKRKFILTLAGRHDEARRKCLDAEEQLQESTRQLELCRKELELISVDVDTEELHQAIQLSHKLGDVDQVLARKKLDMAALKSICENEIKRLGLWTGDLSLAESLAVPLAETVDRYVQEFFAVSEALRVIRQDREKLTKGLLETEKGLAGLRQSGEIPTEEDLWKTRKSRDQGWNLLRRKLMDGDNIDLEWLSLYGDAKPPLAYEENIALADEISDRLRREVDKVHQFATLKAREKGERQQVEKLALQEERQERKLAGLEVLWQQEWASCQITPLSPREMTAWLSRFEKIRILVSDIRKHENEIRELEDARGLKKILLSSAIDRIESRKFPENEIEPVLHFAEKLFSKYNEKRKKKEQLQEKKNNAANNVLVFQEKYDKARKGLAALESQWSELVSSLGLFELKTEEAGDFLEILRECFEKLNEAEILQKRIDGIIIDRQQFGRDVVEVTRLAVFANSDLDMEQTVMALHAALKQARENQTRKKQFVDEIAKEEKEEKKASIAQAAAHERYARLCKLARCNTREELDRAEQLSQQYKSLKEKLASIEETLIQMAEGMDLSPLEIQAGEVDPDELPGRIADISQKIHGILSPQIKSLSEIIGKEKKNLELMDGKSLAAEKAQMAEEKLVRINRLSGQYTRLKVASRILAEEIEHYREKNQDPVLQLASDYFSRLTLRSFTGLRTDEDDKRNPVLVGMREGDVRVGVEQMSSGTRDQLYLSLRLASLDWRHRKSEPLPFIVDDILINFDDARTAVTLQMLAEMAQKSQVILFTHHEQVVRSATELGAQEMVHIHRLSE